MTLTYRNGISIALIVVYLPFLVVGVILAMRHGIRRSSGWLFLIIFSLLRIIGSCLQLATISDPRNIHLYIGSAICTNVGLAPLVLCSLGLVGRVADSISKSHKTFVSYRILRVVQLIVTVGTILGITGGIDSGDDYSTTGKWTVQTKSIVGTVLFIVAYAAVLLMTIITSFHLSHAEAGEKRLLVAIGLSLPLLLVRLIYSIMATIVKNPKFNLLSGSPTILLCVALLEEIVVVIIYEGVGLTLRQISNAPRGDLGAPRGGPSGYPSDVESHQRKPNGGVEMVKSIGRHTIIGRIANRVADSRRDQGVEMTHH
jgi:hypothetical protein